MEKGFNINKLNINCNSAYGASNYFYLVLLIINYNKLIF